MQTLAFLKQWLVLPAIVMSLTLFSSLAGWADSGRLVVITAPWCASCREIIPGLRTLSSQKGYSIQEINVEDDNAQATSASLGISISGSSLPQVYKVLSGRTQLLIDGKGYQLGHPERLIQAIEPQL